MTPSSVSTSRITHERRIQSELLAVLYDLVPENCQLMLATHSIGMMRRARDIEAAQPGTVVFLDFDGLDFDDAQVISPAVRDVAFWNKAYDVALADLARARGTGARGHLRRRA